MHLKSKNNTFILRRVSKDRLRLLKEGETILSTDEVLDPEKPRQTDFWGNKAKTLSVMDNQDRNYLKIR